MNGNVVKSKTTHLDTSRDNEILQSFVSTGVVDEEDEIKEQSKQEFLKSTVENKDENKKHDEQGTQVSNKVIENEVNKKKLLKKKRRRLKPEELYTDKDRAAAVNMGTKDIKQSLKLKRQQDRSKNLQIPEEADPATFLALGNYEMGRKDTQIALNFINKALELNPVEKNALVARSKCYIMLGQPENALKDAETALGIDKKYLKAIYQKAEALYYMGDFEHSLMYFHRGLHVRPDHQNFKLGVEKAQKAIENALGIGTKKRSSRNSTPVSTNRSKSCSKLVEERSQKSACSKKIKKSSRLLRELAVDKDYLDNLLMHPDIRCKHKEDVEDPVVNHIREAVEYLNKRQEFWRQQLPPNFT